MDANTRAKILNGLTDLRAEGFIAKWRQNQLRDLLREVVTSSDASDAGATLAQATKRLWIWYYDSPDLLESDGLVRLYSAKVIPSSH